MSSDYFISKDQLDGLGVEYTQEMEEDYGVVTYATFPEYPYQREVFLHDNNIVHISCAGRFRAWLVAFLAANQVDYEEA